MYLPDSNMSPRHLWTAPESSQTWGHWQLQEADLEAKLTALELELSWALSLGGIQPLALSCVGLWGNCKKKEGSQPRGQEFKEET